MATKWTKEYDNASGQYYYLNSMDGSSTWEAAQAAQVKKNTNYKKMGW